MTIKKTMLAAAVLALGASAAMAQNGPPPGGGGGMSACRDDAQKLCPDKTGPDRRACLEADSNFRFL
jgi:Spy/CpxP family protein refolding chaperone